MGYIERWNHLFCISQHLFGLLFLAFVHQFQCQFGHGTTVGVAHAHYRLVEVDARLVDATELEAVHHVVIGLLCIEVLDTGNRPSFVCGRKRRDAVGQTLSDNIVTQIDVIVVAYRHCYIYRALPVALREHFQNHQVTLVECTFAFQ